MCGRFVLYDFEEKFFNCLKLKNSDGYFIPRYNIYPSDKIPVVFKNNRFRYLELAQWGLIPKWSKTKLIINARVESVNKKPLFNESIRKRRCLIPANGFFEWTEEKSIKQPYFICLKKINLFAFAGIWEEFISTQGKKIKVFAILTTESNSFMGKIHKRMPLILTQKNFEKWLNSPELLLKNLKNLSSNSMNAWKVTRRVGSTNFDNPDCLKKIFRNEEYLKEEKSAIQGSFFD